MFDYDYIMDGDWAHRTRLFGALSSVEKADFVRTHRSRWLAANRGHLSLEQIAAIEEDIAFIVPRLYESPRDENLVAHAKELEQRAIRLFSRQDLYDLTLHGHLVPE